jgi:hypothetical protein
VRTPDVELNVTFPVAVVEGARLMNCSTVVLAKTAPVETVAEITGALRIIVVIYVSLAAAVAFAAEGLQNTTSTVAAALALNAQIPILATATALLTFRTKSPPAAEPVLFATLGQGRLPTVVVPLTTVTAAPMFDAKLIT